MLNRRISVYLDLILITNTIVVSHCRFEFFNFHILEGELKIL
jgi:hypothetical protein